MFVDKKPDQFVTIQTDLEKFSLPLFEKNQSGTDNDFLSKEKTIDLKKKEIDFEKKTTAEEFTVVKKPQNLNKFYTSNNQIQEAQSKDSESSENKTLAEMIGFDQKSLNKKQAEKKLKDEKAQEELRKKIWNYLGEGTDGNGGKSRAGTLTESTGPKLSFEEIMREEQAKKPLPRRSTINVAKHGKDFESKNAWGMKQDDLPITDFGQLIEEEQRKAKKEANLLKE